MDDYSKYYYQRIGSDKGDFGDISARVKLRKDLKCKSFQWYLDNIFPELVNISISVILNNLHENLLLYSSSLETLLRKER
jgi:hypothetical protein